MTRTTGLCGAICPPFGRSLRTDRPKLEFHGSKVTSDAELLAYRELDDALSLTAAAAELLQDSRHGQNGWHDLVGMLRQAVF